jgi:hypothetical protein
MKSWWHGIIQKWFGSPTLDFLTAATVAGAFTQKTQ